MLFKEHLSRVWKLKTFREISLCNIRDMLYHHALQKFVMDKSYLKLWTLKNILKVDIQNLSAMHAMQSIDKAKQMFLECLSNVDVIIRLKHCIPCRNWTTLTIQTWNRWTLQILHTTKQRIDSSTFYHVRIYSI